MNELKRICGTALSGALALSLIVGTGADTTVEGKGKKATLKTKTVTVKVGKTKKIALKNKKKGAKYTYTSSKKKIATVSKSGLVKGVKAGKARITVKESSGKKKRTVGKVKVTVKKVTSSKPQATPTNTATATATPVATATATATPAATATVEPTFEIPVPTSGPLETKKLVDKNNTISAQRYMADPYAIEYEGRIYVYGTNDSQSMVIKEDGKIPTNKYSNINTLNCVSTTDMVNWRDEGII